MDYNWNDDGNDLVISYKNRSFPVGLTFSPRNRYITIRKLNEILAPEHELRVFKVSLDWDTHSLYIKPAAWWAEMDARFPERMASVFAKITAGIDFF